MGRGEFCNNLTGFIGNVATYAHAETIAANRFKGNSGGYTGYQFTTFRKELYVGFVVCSFSS